MSERRGEPVSVTTKVPFHDCDPLFVVWHGRYFEYFELARTELLAKLALDVPEIRALGYRMYVTDARCRYMFPMTYGDEVEITARITETRPLIRVAYEIKNRTHGRKSARGFTVLATTSAAGQLLPETPEIIARKLEHA